MPRSIDKSSDRVVSVIIIVSIIAIVACLAIPALFPKAMSPAEIAPAASHE